MITSAFVNIWNKRAGAVSWDSETGKLCLIFHLEVVLIEIRSKNEQ